MTFQTASNLFKSDRINKLAEDRDGLRFLKLRSLSRRDKLEQLADEVGLNISRTASTDLLKKLYDSRISEKKIESFIRRKFLEERAARKKGENKLIDELYKLQTFDWGGLHQNSLEKTIVDNYVKKIRRYNALCKAIDNELHASLQGYVLCSWYNHWTSIIIEDIFREQRTVLPAIGLVKKIDFFIDNRPFDLKVTYLPEGYIATVRDNKGLRSELTLLKQTARRLGVHFDSSLAASKLIEDLWKKLDDHPSTDARKLIAKLRAFRSGIVQTVIRKPGSLLTWFYENQGARRFDASNRLFLVIIDKTDYHSSWKLKRARPLLVKGIQSSLKGAKRTVGRVTRFRWEGKPYSAVSDAIFVVKG
ncbi:MAG: hypothetical protein HY961_03045 [Ignavibacteriae bacterium]|nr:hypothetical protein [Ignavibacteriota bacterium]